MVVALDISCKTLTVNKSINSFSRHNDAQKQCIENFGDLYLQIISCQQIAAKCQRSRDSIIILSLRIARGIKSKPFFICSSTSGRSLSKPMLLKMRSSAFDVRCIYREHSGKTRPIHHCTTQYQSTQRNRTKPGLTIIDKVKSREME